MLLIVEKNERFKNKLKEHLKVTGLKNFFVNTPKEALAQLDTMKARFLLIDLNSVTSLTEVDALGAYAKRCAVPLLLIKGHQKTEVIAQRLTQKGYKNFITLPFRVSELKREIENLRRNADPFLGAKLGPPGQEVEIVRKLGSGAMGSVYEAYQPALERRVAVKFLSEALKGEDSNAAERFFKEARAMAKLRSSNIAQVFFVGSHASRAYMVMEYIDGPNLDKYLQAKGKLKPREALCIGREVLLGLQHAHEHGQIHRDIKPANIMLNPGGQAVLLDFGLVRGISDESMTQAGTVLGTPRYISPEQVRGADVDHRSDLYALGIILFELMTGLPPFKGKDFYGVLMKHLNEPMPHPRLFGVSMHPAVWDVIERLTRKAQNDRFQSAKEASEVIDRLLKTVPADELNAESLADDAKKTVHDWSGLAVNRSGSAIATFGTLPQGRDLMLGVFNGLIQAFQEVEVLGDFERGNLKLGEDPAVLFPLNDGLAFITSSKPNASDEFEQHQITEFARYFEKR